MDGDEELVLQIRDLDAEEESNSSSSSSSSGSSSLGSSGTVETEPLTASTVTLMSMEPISAANVGSLLRFFQSMFFDSWITISYLYKFREHAGVCDYLCNELYKFQEREVEKYIPQLCILLLNKKEKDSSLARFMMDKCASSMHFALQIAWQLQAYITYGGDRLPTTPQEKEFKERCLRLHEEVEIATVNCKSSLRLRALVDFSPFVSVGGPAKSEGDVVEDIDRSLDPLLYARRLMRSLGARRNSLPQHIDLPSPRRRDSDAPAPVQRSAASPESDAGETEHSASATSATNGDETSAPAAGETASSEDSGNEKDDNELYKDNKEAEEDSYKRWDEALNTDALPQEDAMHIIIGLSKRERAQYYSNVVSFVDKLIDIGEQLILVPEDQRKERLERDLKYLGEHLVDGLYLPICGATDSHHCIVRLLPQESIPLHSKARVPYLFFYEIIESGEKCSAPNLHNFNLESARLGAGVPGVLSPFDEPNAVADPSKAGAAAAAKKPKSKNGSPAAAKRTSQSAKQSVSPLTPSRRVKASSIVRKMGYYSEENLPSLQDEDSEDDDGQENGEWTPDSPFADDRNNGGDHSDADGLEQDDEGEDEGYSLKIGDGSRSESDVVMLEKLYEMGKRSDESDSESQHEESEAEPTKPAPVEEPKPEEPEQPEQPEPQPPAAALAVVPVDVTNGKPDQPEITLCSIFGESWKDKENRIRKESPYSHLPNWKLAAVIVKSGDDLRQEQLASQLLTHFKEIFENGLLPLFLYPLRILVTSADSGLIELIPDSISLHQLKKRTNCMSLAQYFKTVYRTQESLDRARLNFVESMAAYSLVCYFLQVKDRHNGNIMIDSEGHIIHIDYGFFIFNSPGSLNFESAPFKLTPEFVEVMGGAGSSLFTYYKDLLFRGFMEARKYHEKILLILEMWLINSKYNTSVLPCLAGGKPAVDAMAERFRMGYTEKECRDYIDSLVQTSLGSWRTREYDRFQFLTRGVLYSS